VDKTKRFPTEKLKTLDIHGAGERTRTADLLITNQLLYHLSYAGYSKQRPIYQGLRVFSSKINLIKAAAFGINAWVWFKHRPGGGD
jgi:hypothetical protein